MTWSVACTAMSLRVASEYSAELAVSTPSVTSDEVTVAYGLLAQHLDARTMARDRSRAGAGDELALERVRDLYLCPPSSRA